MLASLNQRFRLLAKEKPAAATEASRLSRRFPSVPNEYIELVGEATELEVQHDNGQYLRIWGPIGCIEMDDAYGISKAIAGAIPIGDDGGGKVIFYYEGKQGFGLYHVGFGNLSSGDCVFTAPSLVDLLENAVGVNSF